MDITGVLRKGRQVKRRRSKGRDGQAAMFDRSLAGFFRDAVWSNRWDPRRMAFFLRTAARQRQAAARRRQWEARGVHVPPLLIVSITRRCNLHCTGCFVREQGRPEGAQMSDARIEALFAEARDLGVSVVALAGGEPLTRPGIVEVAARFPEMVFLLVTNGSLVDEAVLATLERASHIIPVVSIEGLAGETDSRRGGGAYAGAVRAMDRMRERKIFFGTSVMVTGANYALVTGRQFVRGLVGRGSRLFFYVDYVPIEPGTGHLVPSESQRAAEPLAMAVLRREFGALFLSSSAADAAYGGCLAAGKGFAHVNAEGGLEPCPFAPYSDVDLGRVSLRVALGSSFLAAIRESGEHLSEAGGGCALWNKREWLESLLDGGGDERLVA